MTREACDAPEITDDRLLEGRVRLLQPRRGHRAGTDAVLLAGQADLRPGDHVVDLGSASGAVGLMAGARVPGIRLTLVERDPLLAALARENLVRNGQAEAEVRNVDLFADRRTLRAAGLSGGMADAVLTNPPFFEGGSPPSPDPGRRAAHVFSGGGLNGWLGVAAWLLKPRGRLTLVHRADALETCLAALAPAFGSTVVVPVRSDPERDAVRILVSAVKGGRAPLRIAPALVLRAGPARGPETELS